MAKRPRSSESLSTGEVDLAPPSLPPSSDVDRPRRSPVRKGKAPKTSDQACSSIFSIASPSDGGLVAGDGRPPLNCGFLEKCHFCNAKILPWKEVYMYRDLRGFCTAACREWQMLIEGAVKMVAAKRARKGAP